MQKREGRISSWCVACRRGRPNLLGQRKSRDCEGFRVDQTGGHCDLQRLVSDASPSTHHVPWRQCLLGSHCGSDWSDWAWIPAATGHIQFRLPGLHTPGTGWGTAMGDSCGQGAPVRLARHLLWGLNKRTCALHLQGQAALVHPLITACQCRPAAWVWVGLASSSAAGGGHLMIPAPKL